MATQAFEAQPLIVQGDGSLLLEVQAPGFDEARSAIMAFSELEKSPEYMHTYRVTALSLWNAAAEGLDADEVMKRLMRYSRFGVPQSIEFRIRDLMSRYGLVRMSAIDEEHLPHIKALFAKEREAAAAAAQEAEDAASEATAQIEQAVLGAQAGVPATQRESAPAEIEMLALHMPDMLKKACMQRKPFRNLVRICCGSELVLPLTSRGTLKLFMAEQGYPIDDQAPLKDGEPLDVSLATNTKSTGKPLQLRPYQEQAVSAFCGDLGPGTGFGTMVLPCGSGKTLIGMAIMARLGMRTLILCPNRTALMQWKRELLDKTTLTEEQVAEYSSDEKKIGAVTLTTYQMLSWRPDVKQEHFPHFALLHSAAWGLVIYDEVHLLPAPLFRITAEIQATRRVGLTATLVREDGRETEVFSLVGPKRYDVPWKEMEEDGWIAEARCREIRLPLDVSLQMDYAVAKPRQKYRIAAENPAKLKLIPRLLEMHKGEAILIIGMYLDQLKMIAEELGVPVLTGETPLLEREELFKDFRSGKTKVLVVSKVANLAVDLPDSSVAIQVSGSFGSRQEEAQRLGRLLRPKDHPATFYTLVSQFTQEETFSQNRQRFLAEQGYPYEITALNLDDPLPWSEEE